MSRITEWLRKAEEFARGHSKQADQIIDRAEQYAKERTGHKYDKYIEQGADTVQRRYGGQGEQQPGQAQPGQAQPGQAQPEGRQPGQAPQEQRPGEPPPDQGPQR
ncbi:MAG TPA: antitoxin [Nonomuraea sp.]|nr:antitoxin [Nonomuraea sp.]